MCGFLIRHKGKVLTLNNFTDSAHFKFLRGLIIHRRPPGNESSKHHHLMMSWLEIQNSLEQGPVAARSLIFTTFFFLVLKFREETLKVCYSFNT